MNYIDECLERAEKVTPGTWSADDCSHYHSNASGPDEYEVGPSTFECTEYHKGFGLEPAQAKIDAEFIAHARTDVEVLAIRLKKAIESLRNDNSFMQRHVADELESPLEKK